MQTIPLQVSKLGIPDLLEGSATVYLMLV